MKKVLLKTVIISVFILLIPFIITLLVTDHKSKQLSIHDFEIYYEANGSKKKLEFEEYLMGVVAANMPAGYDIEALKAQAVIARTYALYNIALLSDEISHGTSYTTSELGLAYINMEDMKQYWTSDDYLTHFTKIENCVYGTKDEILVYQNDLILPVFFDTGCGFTRNASEAWGVDIPYLVSVPSKQDVTSTSYLKITEYSKENLVLLLESYYSNVDISEASFFDDVRVTERDSTGYVTKVNLGNHTVSGEEFTKVIGLNSNHFYIEDYEDKVRLICNGVGHGVGLSQYGTNAMALEGKTYEEILKHYYTGVELVNIGKDE